MADPKRVYHPEEVHREVASWDRTLEKHVKVNFDDVPVMDYDEALGILSWHLSLNTATPGAGDPSFASAFKTVMLKLIGEKR